MIILAETCRWEVMGFCLFYLAEAKLSIINYQFSIIFRTFEPRSKVLTFEKTQILFGILLTYSYLCPHKDQLYENKTTTYLANLGFNNLLIRSGEGL